MIDLLERALRECPDNLWGASVWKVKLTDRHVWPMPRSTRHLLPVQEFPGGVRVPRVVRSVVEHVE